MIKLKTILPLFVLALTPCWAQDFSIGDSIDEEAGKPRPYFEGTQTQPAVLPVSTGNPRNAQIAAELKERVSMIRQLDQEIPKTKEAYESAKDHSEERQFNTFKGYIFGGISAFVAGLYALKGAWVAVAIAGGLALLLLSLAHFLSRPEAKRAQGEAEELRKNLRSKIHKREEQLRGIESLATSLE